MRSADVCAQLEFMWVDRQQLTNQRLQETIASENARLVPMTVEDEDVPSLQQRAG